ncbi:MAG: hypothetical protein M3O70_07730 [Actinomycetota bacterium]|nr:hypothetical protein [Actinomycetota bacterium]
MTIANLFQTVSVPLRDIDRLELRRSTNGLAIKAAVVLSDGTVAAECDAIQAAFLRTVAWVKKRSEAQRVVDEIYAKLSSSAPDHSSSSSPSA